MSRVFAFRNEMIMNLFDFVHIIRFRRGDSTLKLTIFEIFESISVLFNYLSS